MSCDEEQVCLMIKQVQVKAISDGGYGPFSNSMMPTTKNQDVFFTPLATFFFKEPGSYCLENIS